MHGAGYTGTSLEDRRKRSLDALSAMTSRTLPTPYDHHRIAEALLDGKPVDPETMRAMQSSLTDRAQNPRGINEDELQSRRTVNARPRSATDYLVNQPGMELGAGDQKNYAALRDSNLLNAALDKSPVESLDAMRDGAPDGGDAYHWWNPADWLASPEQAAERKRRETIDTATSMWEQGEKDPTRWGDIVQSAYPQHSWIGWGGSLDRPVGANGGTIAGDLLAWTGRWEEGGNRAMFTPDPPIDPLANRGWDEEARGLGKWLTGAWQGADGEQKHRTVRGLVGRGSPLLPGSMTPGTTEADAHIAALKGLTDATEKPSVDEHAASRGETLDHATKAFRENRFVWADPFTAASLAASGGSALLGKGALKALLSAGVREGVQEAGQPLNWAGVVASAINGPEQVETTPEEYAAKRTVAEDAFRQIPEMTSKYRTQR